MLWHAYPDAPALSRVVVLGARGFVASRLIRRLREGGIPCRPVGSGEVDLTVPTCVATLRGIVRSGDALVMTSALTPERGRDRATFLRNVAMADHVCTSLAEAPCTHVLYISSDSVYAPASDPIDEECCCESGDMYALSHIVREKLLADACGRRGIPFAILRPTAIYGAADTHNSYGPNRFLRSALRQRKITLFGQGEEERDHVFIDDVVKLIVLCLLHRSSGILNAASGEALSFQCLARTIMAVVGGLIAQETAERSVPIIHRRFRINAIRRAFPDFRGTSFEIGIRQAYEELMRAEGRDICPTAAP